jgi:hypothetical protein
LGDGVAVGSGGVLVDTLVSDTGVSVAIGRATVFVGGIDVAIGVEQPVITMLNITRHRAIDRIANIFMSFSWYIFAITIAAIVFMDADCCQPKSISHQSA